MGRVKRYFCTMAIWIIIPFVIILIYSCFPQCSEVKSFVETIINVEMFSKNLVSVFLISAFILTLCYYFIPKVEFFRTNAQKLVSSVNDVTTMVFYIVFFVFVIEFFKTSNTKLICYKFLMLFCFFFTHLGIYNAHLFLNKENIDKQTKKTTKFKICAVLMVVISFAILNILPLLLNFIIKAISCRS